MSQPDLNALTFTVNVPESEFPPICQVNEDSPFSALVPLDYFVVLPDAQATVACIRRASSRIAMANEHDKNRLITVSGQEVIIETNDNHRFVAYSNRGHEIAGRVNGKILMRRTLQQFTASFIDQSILPNEFIDNQFPQSFPARLQKDKLEQWRVQRNVTCVCLTYMRGNYSCEMQLLSRQKVCGRDEWHSGVQTLLSKNDR